MPSFLGGSPSSLRTDKFLDVSHLSGPELLPNLLFSFERNGLWVRKGHSPRAFVFLWTNLYFPVRCVVLTTLKSPPVIHVLAAGSRLPSLAKAFFPRSKLPSTLLPSPPEFISTACPNHVSSAYTSNNQQFSVAVLRPSLSPRCRASACSHSVWVPRGSTAASVDHDTPCHEQRRISPRRTVHIKREKNN